MPEGVLYAIIGFLGAALLALSGLWVRAHDEHRKWSTDKITEQERRVSIVESTQNAIRQDIVEIKETLQRRDERESKFQAALVAKLDLRIE